MEKINKRYVQYIYPNDREEFLETENTNPENVEIKKQCIKFRFVEQDFIIDGNEKYIGTIRNLSKWFFVGKRITIDETRRNYMKNFDGVKSVCITEYGVITPIEDYEMTLEEYIMAKRNKEQKAIRMFEKLKSHIGKRVSYRIWVYGVEQCGTQILKDVNYFENVEMKNMSVPFVGYGAAISSITLEETGEVLYSNPYIEYGYDKRDWESINESIRKIFGDDIADKERESQIKDQNIRNPRKEELKAIKKSKYQIMKEGLPLIRPEKVEEWLQYVDDNCNDYYSAIIVKAVISLMKKIGKGISFAEAERQVFLDEFDLSLLMTSLTAKAVSIFSKNGEEYRKYWNKKYGVSESEDIVNPAILTLKNSN